MPKHNDYRSKAKECVAQAELMRRPNERAIMLQMALSYMKLADIARERHDRATAHRDLGHAHPENDS